MRLRWGWVLAGLALCAGATWWMRPDVVARILRPEPHRHAPSHRRSGRADAGPTLYRWVDADGVVNITTAHPPAGRHYTIVRIDPNQNIVPMSARQAGERR